MILAPSDPRKVERRPLNPNLFDAVDEPNLTQTQTLSPNPNANRNTRPAIPVAYGVPVEGPDPLRHQPLGWRGGRPDPFRRRPVEGRSPAIPVVFRQDRLERPGRYV